MSAKTKIEWTDATFNPWIGCTKVAPGCANCYAEADMDSRRHRVKWGPHGTRSKTSGDYWKQPLKWNREALEKFGRPMRVFCASVADVFEDWEGPIVDSKGEVLVADSVDGSYHAACTGDTSRNLTMADLRRDLFKLIDATPNLIWQLVTKRPENVLKMWPIEHGNPVAPFPGMPGPLGQPLRTVCRKRRPNVHLLTSISDQATADKATPELLKCRDLVPVLGVSAEPLLGPLSLAAWLDRLDWVIAGGESGHAARPIHPDWPRSLRDECAVAGVPFFFKQWGAWKPISEMSWAESDSLYRSRRKAKPHEDQAALDDAYGRECTVETCGIQHDGARGWQGGDPFVIPYQTFRVGKKAAGRLLDGVEHNGMPEVTHA